MSESRFQAAKKLFLLFGSFASLLFCRFAISDPILFLSILYIKSLYPLDESRVSIREQMLFSETNVKLRLHLSRYLKSDCSVPNIYYKSILEVIKCDKLHYFNQAIKTK